MIATYVSPLRTHVSPEGASRAIRSALSKIAANPSPEAVAVIHAHQALETWHFKSCWNWGVGNIKAGPEYRGLYTAIVLNERLKRDGVLRYVWFDPVLGELLAKGGAPRYPEKRWTLPPAEPQCRMRAYESLAAAEDEKLTRFFTQDRWRPALERAIRGDPSGFVRAIKAEGYFTAELGPYERSVVSLTATYLPVAIAMAADAPVPAPAEDTHELCTDIALCHRFELPPALAARLEALRAEHVHDVMDRLRADRDRELAGWADETEPTSPETPESKDHGGTS